MTLAWDPKWSRQVEESPKLPSEVATRIHRFIHECPGCTMIHESERYHDEYCPGCTEGQNND